MMKVVYCLQSATVCKYGRGTSLHRYWEGFNLVCRVHKELLAKMYVLEFRHNLYIPKCLLSEAISTQNMVIFFGICYYNQAEFMTVVTIDRCPVLTLIIYVHLGHLVPIQILIWSFLDGPEGLHSEQALRE